MRQAPGRSRAALDMVLIRAAADVGAAPGPARGRAADQPVRLALTQISQFCN